MAVISISKIKCDRCGALMDERPQYDPARVRVSFEVAVHRKPTECMRWIDLCVPCNAYALRAYGALQRSEAVKGEGE
jgi:hypothetical protein